MIQSDEIQISLILQFHLQKGLIWIRIWLFDIETCLKSIIRIIRKSFLVDVWTIYSFFWKKHIFRRKNKERHLAYSFFQEPCIVIDWLALSLEPKFLLMFRHKSNLELNPNDLNRCCLNTGFLLMSYYNSSTFPKYTSIIDLFRRWCESSIEAQFLNSHPKTSVTLIYGVS